MAARAIAARSQGGRLVDVGCGVGNFRRYLALTCYPYIGADVVRYPAFPPDAEFVPIDPRSGTVSLPDGAGDIVVCLETIEHVENPRALFRELTRLTRPGGLIVVTTPNQLSLLSKLTLLVKHRFNAFQDGTGNAYPTHITALLEIDLIRIARECGLEDPQILYSDDGRIPGTGRRWPAACRGRAFSDNIGISAIRPLGPSPREPSGAPSAAE
ncbi:MAG: class I SAM-dependent methyltransferase [Gemmatimonadota bacterium]|nr:class I SAM-dependent methyltransferase [Gemmatimonadota bacterium]